MAIFLLLGFALWAIRKRPLMAYCILFFFLNHLIEGSILPLELLFEHRNYLPSTFLFLLPSLLAVHVLDYFSYRRSIQTCVCAVIVLLLASHGHTSYLRNRVLKTEISLWSDVVKKVPALSRPHINLSNALFRAGRNSEAFVLLDKAKGAKPGPNPRSKALPAHNLGHYYLSVGEIDKSMALFREALDLDPSTARAYHGLGKAMFFKGLLEDAEKNIRQAISLDPHSALFHRSLSVILLRANRVNAAMKEAVRAMQLDHTLDEPFYILGEAYRIKKLWRKAAYYFEEFIKRRPGSLHAHMALIEIYGEIGEMSQVKHHAFALMAGKGQRGLMDVLLEFDSQINFLDSDRVNTVLAFVRTCLKEEAQGLEAIYSPTQKRHGSNIWHQPLLQGPEPLSPTQP
jgi:tetratricopeptide (TPR) repeat protein